MAGAEGGRAARKQAYFTKLLQLLEEYNKIVIVGADNVGSNQMQKIRIALRGKGVLLMGKNTMIRKAIKGQASNNPALNDILPHVWGNIGFIFTKGDLSQIKKVVIDHKVAAPAKVGTVAPSKVIVPAGNTGMEPTQTSFLQALNIQSKITRGQIEIIADVAILEAGQKVGQSEATLLQKLGIKPFTYGLVLKTVYDNGTIYDPKILDMTDEEILAKFHKGVRNVASVSLAIHYPTIASVPHLMSNAFKNVISVALAIDYKIAATDKLKSAPAPKVEAKPKEDKGGKGGKGKEKEPEKEKEPKKSEKKKDEPKEEEEEDLGLGLFD
jgi:large subunit ribosomal protein LP0